jgi:UDP-glucuronate 4-epimerase
MDDPTSRGQAGSLALVTGAAGFIGSHLVERLLADGVRVRAVDTFTPYYSVALKQRIFESLSRYPGCTTIRADLRTCSLDDLFEGVDVVFHQSGQPGVRASWKGFSDYLTHNVSVTERLLTAALGSGIDRFVYASSSSVYGDAARHPTPEDALPRPVSPYGVTKLAAEHLCGVFAVRGVPTVSLRYFTVYGPRQRPDMALQRLIEASLTGRSFPMYGDGRQLRDLTYVDDVVEANLAAWHSVTPAGTVVNIAGGTVTDLRGLIGIVEEVTGRPVRVEPHSEQPGDVRSTSGSTALAGELLGWRPKVTLLEGITEQVAWQASGRDLVRTA